MNDKAFLNLQERIIKSWCYMSNGSFNKCCFVALLKTLCLERQMLNAYMHLCFARNHTNIFRDASQSFQIYDGELAKLVFLSDAIIAYNNCVDTVLQILYFGLEFMPEFNSQRDYEKYLKQCKWPTIKKVLFDYTSLNHQHVEFYNRTVEFYTAAKPIRTIANAIKHHGGIVSKHTQIPCPPGYTIQFPKSVTSTDNLPSIQSMMDMIQKGSSDVFSPKSVLPFTIDFEEYITYLEDANSLIYDFAHYIFRYIGLYDATKSNLVSHQTFRPIFSIRNGTKQDK